jgi:hypothetical protein
MPRCSTILARGAAIPMFLALSALSAGASAQADEGDGAAPAPDRQALFGQAPLPESDLAATTGREQSAWMSASTSNTAVVADNHVGDNNVTGAVNVAGSAFQNVSGITMVNFNTGNNSSINAAMSVNLHINYAAPAAP